MMRPMLAATAKQLSDFRYPLLLSPKIDGIRALKQGGQLLSRNWKPIRNRHIPEALAGLPDGCDGELVAAAGSFQDTTSAVMSFDGRPDFVYRIFDFFADLQLPYNRRVQTLPSLAGRHVVPVLPDLAETEAELLAFEGKCLADGYEGIMARSPSSPYKLGRSTLKEGFLVKFKRFHDGEAVILGIHEALHNSNEQEADAFGYMRRPGSAKLKLPKGTAGGFQVRDLATGVEFCVGGGLTDSLRAEVWADQDSYIGKVLKYRCQMCGVKQRPRFPTFLGFVDE